MHRHPRISPAIYQVSITGPYRAEGHGDTPSRRRIFVCEPKEPGDEEACARRILSTLDAPGLSAAGHRRGPPEADGVLPAGACGGGLRRGDRDGPERGAGEPAVPVPHRAGPARRRAELGLSHPATSSSRPACRSSSGAASRTTSCSTWRRAASCSKPEVLERQVRRMLADPRSRSLVTNFADQWLHLRNLDSITPDLRLFPDFDDNLRQAFRQETELLFESVLREDRSVLDLLKSDHTLPERAPGQALRHPARLRQPLPPRRARRRQRAGRPAPPGEHPDRDLLRDPHLARDPRQVDPREHPRHAAAAAARERAGAEGQHGLVVALGPRAAGRAPRQRRLRGLSQADGPGRLRARELRRGRPLADLRGGQAGRRDRGPSRRQPVRGRGRPRAGPAEASGAVRRHADREAPDVRPGAGRRVTTTPRRSARSSATPGRRIIASRR